MSTVESHLGLLVSIVRSVKILCWDELCCLRHKSKVSDLFLLYKIYYRVGHPMNEQSASFSCNLYHFLAAAPDELAFVIPRCRTDQFSRSFLPAAERM